MTSSIDTNGASSGQDWSARAARPADADELVALIRELAVYERLEHLVQVTPDQLARQLFGPRPTCEALVVEVPRQDRAAGPERHVVAFALYFHNFSTFLGKPGLYLEDLYVRPPWRGLGIGKGLLRHLARLAVERDCGRFEWSVLEWNKQAIDVYRAAGAELMEEWRICRVAGDALTKLAGE